MSSDTGSVRTLADGFGFPEGPCWRDGLLYVSDIFRRRVVTVDMDGTVTPLVDVPGRPSGLGFAPDGSLIIAVASQRRILRYSDGQLNELADLADHGEGTLNDMYVDPDGRIYVGSLGIDLWDPDPSSVRSESEPPESDGPPVGSLQLVTLEGGVSTVATEIDFANGITNLLDTSVLVIAESHSHQLTAFDVAADGTLSNRRVHAVFDEEVNPDGICLDAEGGLWIASFSSNEVLRLGPDGTISHRLPRDHMTLSCALGGPEGRSLFIVETRFSSPETIDAIEQASVAGTEIFPDRNDGFIEVVDVDVPSAR